MFGCSAPKRRITKRSQRRRRIAVVLLVLYLIIVSFGIYIYFKIMSGIDDPDASVFADGGIAGSGVTYACADTDERESPSAQQNSGGLSYLEQQVYDFIDMQSGSWSVYFKNLDSGESFEINDREIYAASLIKLYAMSAAYEKIESGSIEESSIYDTIKDMIIYSDNECFNDVIWTIGTTAVNEWCAENGYSDTEQNHGLYPADNADGLQTSTQQNVTTVTDCGELLESIYRKECVSEYASKQMLDILLDQQMTDKIPSGVPNGVAVANKTGETNDECHDAAIVFSDGADYILVVMIEDEGNGWNDFEPVSELSELVYDFFNEE
ncbi:MAG: serine hydrolase [Oscillospiraceae bacterium]